MLFIAMLHTTHRGWISISMTLTSNLHDFGSQTQCFWKPSSCRLLIICISVCYDDSCLAYETDLLWWLAVLKLLLYCNLSLCKLRTFLIKVHSLWAFPHSLLLSAHLSLLECHHWQSLAGREWCSQCGGQWHVLVDNCRYESSHCGRQ